MENRRNKTGKYLLAGAVLVTAFVLALFFGGTRLSPGAVFGGLLGFGGETAGVIMRSVRLPRVLGCVLCGTGLSVSGIILQSITDNGLAGPNIVGVNSGAGLGAILFLFFFPGAVKLMPLCAFGGAFLTTLGVLWLSKRIGGGRHSVILGGLALNAVLNAGISFVSLLDGDVLTSYNYFSVGGLSGVMAGELAVPGAIIALGWTAAFLLGKRMTVLSLGDGVAASLGISVERLRIAALLCASASAAAVVSFAGLLGFVGLVVPHILRRLFGSGVRECVLGAPFVGGALVLCADLLGRVVIAPAEVPVGIIMALIGAPFFIFVLARREKRG